MGHVYKRKKDWVEAPKYPGLQVVFDDKMNKMREAKPPLRYRCETSHSRIDPKLLEKSYQNHLRHDLFYDQESEVLLLQCFLHALHVIAELDWQLFDAWETGPRDQRRFLGVAGAELINNSLLSLKNRICRVGTGGTFENLLTPALISLGTWILRMKLTLVSRLQSSKSGLVKRDSLSSSMYCTLRETSRDLRHRLTQGVLQRLAITYAMPTQMMQSGLWLLVEYLKKNCSSSDDIIVDHISFARAHFDEFQRDVPRLTGEWNKCQQGLNQYLVEMSFDFHSTTTSRWNGNRDLTRDKGGGRGAAGVGGGVVFVANEPPDINGERQSTFRDKVQNFVPMFDVQKQLGSTGWLYYGQALAWDFKSYTRVFLSLARRGLIESKSTGNSCGPLMIRLEQQMTANEQAGSALAADACFGGTILDTSSGDAGFTKTVEMTDYDIIYNPPGAQWTDDTIDPSLLDLTYMDPGLTNHDGVLTDESGRGFSLS